MFGKKKHVEIPRVSYDPENMEAVLKCNTCNSDRVVGFSDRTTGEFHEVMNIRFDSELEEFKAMYGIERIREVYGW